MSDAERLARALTPLYHVEGGITPVRAGWTARALTSDGMSCRLTILAPELRAQLRAPDQFAHELERAAPIAHEGLVPSTGGGVLESGDAYYAREDVPAPSARERLTREGPLAADDVAQLGARVADTLAVVHGAGLVHGAITPDALLLPPGGARLADLGVHAALAAAGVAPAIITARLDLEHYASPEQLAGRPLDARSDVYSLGSMLYELLTGRPPFGGRTTSSVMVNVLTEEASARATSGARGTGTVINAILRAIEKDPDDRWPSAAAFAAALRASPHRPGSQRSARRAKRGCLPALLLAGALLAIALSAAVR